MKTLLRFLKFAFLVQVLTLISFSLFAQTDSTAIAPLGGLVGKIPAWVWALIFGIYEFIIRWVPTAKNWSILSFVIKAVQLIAPNNSTVTKPKATDTHE